MDQIKISQSVIERIYEIPVGRIMRTDMRTVTPETSMKSLEEVVKENAYACTPVVSEDNLVGQISIENYIKWFITGDENNIVSDCMEINCKTMHPEEPVITAIRELDIVGLRGLPVVEANTNKYLGILCRCRMMEGILAELDMNNNNEKTKNSSEYTLEGLRSDSAVMNLSYKVEPKSLEYGGEVASSIRTDLYKIGLPGNIVRRAAIAAYEAEMNILSYAVDGSFTISLRPRRLGIKIEDNGPGIPDIDKAMEPGYSTAPDWVRELGFGAGMGLVNIKNCSDNFRISSKIGIGTRLELGINMEAT